MKKLILLSIMVVFLFSAVNADYLVKQETVTGPMMGQPGKTDVQNLWIGDGVYANVTKALITIVNSNKKVMYIVYPATKTYVEMKMPLDISTYLPEAAKGMMETMLKSMTMKVTANGKTAKVGKWNTKGYTGVMTMSQMGMEIKVNMDLSATEDVPFDWKKISAEYMGNMMMSTGSMSNKVVNEMKKIKGYVVKTVVTMNIMGMNMTVNNNVLEISKKDAPAGTFSVPAGFKKVDKLAAKKRGM